MDNRSLSMVQENPSSNKVGRKGSRAPHIVARIKQLRDNPGVWFVWAEDSYATTGSVWGALVGWKTKSAQWNKSCWQVSVRSQPNGKYRKYVRYIGESREYL